MSYGGGPSAGPDGSSTRDVAELERALEEMEQRFSALAEASVDGVVISVDGVVLEVNRAGAAMLGLQTGDVVASSIATYFDEADLEIVAKNIASGREEPYQVTLRRPDGLRIPVEIRAKNVQYRGRRARATLVRDITERRRTFAALGRWEHLFRHAHFGIASFRDEMRFELINPAFASMHGYAMEELLGEPIWRVVPQTSEAQVRADLELAASGGRRIFEAVHVRKDGSEFPVLIDLSVVPQEEPGLRYYAVHVRDQSAKKEAEKHRAMLEERVRHAQTTESLAILAGGIAHDFNNLLVGILGNADVLVSELPVGSRVRTGAENLRTAARRAAELTQQMLAYSGKGRFVLASLDLNGLVEEMPELLNLTLGRQVPIRLELLPDLPEAPGDLAQVRQVLLNLLLNAVDAIVDESGEIAVRTGVSTSAPEGFVICLPGPEAPSSSFVFVEVSDTGIGMDEGTMRRMFEPFFTTKFAGRGLGLAVVLGVVKAHHGSILVRSAPDGGTTIRVMLPTGSIDVERAPVSSTPPSAKWRGTGRVLVVDDEVAVRHVASAILTRAGFEVVVAQNGFQALEFFDAEPDAFRLVLLDMTMPELGGAEVFHALRARRPNLPVLLSSGYDESQAVTELGSAFPVHFIQKPYEVAALLSRVRSLLEPAS